MSRRTVITTWACGKSTTRRMTWRERRHMRRAADGKSHWGGHILMYEVLPKGQ